MRDGHRFFAERRLLPQGDARRGERIARCERRRALDRICDRARRSRAAACRAVLVHGDLWSANLHACANGELALIDAGAVHHGWAEADLAMLTLFGEPPPAFFAAYEAESGIDASWRERAPIYNLYHLLESPESVRRELSRRRARGVAALRLTRRRAPPLQKCWRTLSASGIHAFSCSMRVASAGCVDTNSGGFCLAERTHAFPELGRFLRD